MANTATIAVTIAVVIAVGSMMVVTVNQASNDQADGEAYCETQYPDQLEHVVWKQTGDSHELQCRLDNGTLVDVPSEVFSS